MRPPGRVSERCQGWSGAERPTTPRGRSLGLCNNHRRMRIATWNLERGRAIASQQAAIDRLRADILILTEPPKSYTSGPSVVTSPSSRHGRRGLKESWVAIVGSSTVTPVAMDIPFERLAAAAKTSVAGRHVLVYGSVLPWNSVRSRAPYVCRIGESSYDTFLRVLCEQVADVSALRRNHDHDLIIWAGDFNQSLAGPIRGGSRQKRNGLTDALKTLGLEAWNGLMAHASEGLCAVDLICSPRNLPPIAQGRLDPLSSDNVVMSDHAGYWLDFP